MAVRSFTTGSARGPTERRPSATSTIYQARRGPGPLRLGTGCTRLLMSIRSRTFALRRFPVHPPTPSSTPCLMAGRRIARARCGICSMPAPALVLVATDRISAFDYVLGSGSRTRARCSRSCRRSGSTGRATSCRTTAQHRPGGIPRAVSGARRRCWPAGRCWCGRPTPFPIECVARGYLSGSGWKEYVQTGSVCGIACPPGCASRTGCPTRSSRRRPRPRPATTSTSARRRPRRSSAPTRVAHCGG